MFPGVDDSVVVLSREDREGVKMAKWISEDMLLTCDTHAAVHTIR